MLKQLRILLHHIIDDIDSGNSNADEKELQSIVDFINNVTRKDVTMTKYVACKYMKLGRAQFDNYVRDGYIPKGKHEQGGTLRWSKRELDESIKKLKDKRYGKLCRK